MWATFDDSDFPFVKIKMTGVPADDDDFQNFINKWDSYNLTRNHYPYIFIFDTREVGFVNIKYSFRMSSFIKQLKTSEHQYLRGSVIVTGGMWSKFLLKVIFWTQRPVAPVYLTDSNDPILINDIANNINLGIEKLYNHVSIVRP